MPHITRMHWMERSRLLGTFQVLELYNQGNGNFLALARALKNCLAARHFFGLLAIGKMHSVVRICSFGCFASKASRC